MASVRLIPGYSTSGTVAIDSSCLTKMSFNYLQFSSETCDSHDVSHDEFFLSTKKLTSSRAVGAPQSEQVEYTFSGELLSNFQSSEFRRHEVSSWRIWVHLWSIDRNRSKTKFIQSTCSWFEFSIEVKPCLALVFISQLKWTLVVTFYKVTLW